MSSRRAAARTFCVGVLLLTACAQLGVRGAAAPPSLQDEWLSARTQVEREVLASRFGAADKLLTDFATRHPNTVEASETAFWRALYKLDPTNQTGTPREAIVLLDGYLNASLAAPHRGAATALRRVATVLDRPPTVVAAPAPSAPSGAKADDKARDEELARVKDELSKANAELERIKRRVAAPKP
jgi:hypothetical protein